MVLFFKTVIILLVFTFLQVSLTGNAGNETVRKLQQPPDTFSLKIIFAGDVMGHDPQILSAWDSVNKIYNYQSCFSVIKPFVESADIAVANLEVTLGGPPYKGYPEFSSPDALAVALKNAGFDLLVQANNHCLDRGKKGLTRTIRTLDSLKILHTGTFINKSERDSLSPLIFEKNGFRIALLNYTYGTNGIQPAAPVIVNYIDTAVIKSDLQKAGKMSPDYIIVTIHWGLEYERTQNSEQKSIAEFILAHGADLIIGSHPHVVQPVEIIRRKTNDSINPKIIVYSLGNFISNQRSRYRDGGIIFEIELKKIEQKTWLNNFGYLPVWVSKELSATGNAFSLIPPGFLISNSEETIKANTFYNDTRQLLPNIPEYPFFNNTNERK